MNVTMTDPRYNLSIDREQIHTKLKVNKFENMTVRYPMAKDGNKTLYWTIEHHAFYSKGGYEVVKGNIHYIWFTLQEAVDCFNEI